jgi:hypothetical protein
VLQSRIKEIKELVQSFVLDKTGDGVDISYEKLREYGNFGWFYLIEEAVNDKSNKIMNFIIQTIRNHTEMMTIKNVDKGFAYEIIMKDLVSKIHYYFLIITILVLLIYLIGDGFSSDGRSCV